MPTVGLPTQGTRCDAVCTLDQHLELDIWAIIADDGSICLMAALRSITMHRGDYARPENPSRSSAAPPCPG